MAKQDYPARIAQYLDQEMSPTERQAFEAELQQDPQFAAEFELRRQIYLAVWQEGMQAQRAELQALADQLLPQDDQAASKPSTPIRPLYRQPWAIVSLVASLALLLLLWLYDFESKPEALGPQVFAEYYPGKNAKEIVPLTLPESFQQGRRGDQSSTQSDPLPPDSVLARIQTYIANHPDRSEGYFYLGAHHFRQQAFPEAIAAFSQVPADHAKGEFAQWFRALALLQLGKLEEARSLLTNISQQAGHKRQAEAQTILNHL